MRTNIEIDDGLLKQAMASTGETTKRATVERALRLLVQMEAQKGIQSLFGKITFYEDYDYKAMRKSKHEPVELPVRRKKVRP